MVVVQAASPLRASPPLQYVLVPGQPLTADNGNDSVFSTLGYWAAAPPQLQLVANSLRTNVHSSAR